MKIHKDPWMIKILKHLRKERVAHTAEIARGAHIATTTAHKYLDKLVEDGFVTVQRMGAGKPVFWEMTNSNLKKVRQLMKKKAKSGNKGLRRKKKSSK